MQYRRCLRPPLSSTFATNDFLEDVVCHLTFGWLHPATLTIERPKNTSRKRNATEVERRREQYADRGARTLLTATRRRISWRMLSGTVGRRGQECRRTGRGYQELRGSWNPGFGQFFETPKIKGHLAQCIAGRKEKRSCWCNHLVKNAMINCAPMRPILTNPPHDQR